jgi:hypothetical protein
MKNDSQPKATVLAAYEAANRGQHRKANELLAPEVRKMLARSHALIVSRNKGLRKSLLRFKGRRDETALQARKTIQACIKVNRTFAGMSMGRSAFLGRLWNSATRGRSLVNVEVTRQVIRGSRARVYLRLTLRDGTVVKDSEPLVFRRGRWLLG